MSNSINVTVRPTRTIVTKPSAQRTVLVNQNDIRATGGTLSALTDVDISARVDGSLLIYDSAEEKFITSTLLEKQTLNGGHY